MELRKIWEWIQRNRFLDETYFILLSVILAFGLLQTTGTALETEKPVVSVISTSMCPELQVGDILIVKHEEFSDIEEGDVIVYNVPDTAQITVGGEEYELRASDENPTPAVNTSIGEIELVDVRPGRDRNRDTAVFRLDGEIIAIDGQRQALREGESYLVEGTQLEVGYMTDLPQDGVPIVHRVAEKNEDHVETMGDNNPTQLEFEKEVRPNQIHGTVFFKIPRLGLVKILGMDLVGFSGDKPLVIDNTPSCG
jgi:signal peptidase I